VARFKAATADEPGKVFDPCRSRLLDHGARTAVAVVLIHGLTNCPRQFVELGEELQRAGANVVILRVPRHGLASADGRSIGGVGNVGGLTQQELRDYADHAVDIGDGLGEHVRVLGLSMGGVIAAWIAQNRPDVERSVAVAPALTIPVGPPFLNTMFRNAVSRLPNITVPGAATLDHAYEGSSTRALAAMYQLSESVRNAAARNAPVVSSIAVVTNANDDQVNNTDIRSLADAWQRHGATVRRYDFPKALGLPHDLIDVQQPRHRGDLVDHVLLDLLGFGR
jgi:carboxylesterase